MFSFLVPYLRVGIYANEETSYGFETSREW